MCITFHGVVTPTLLSGILGRGFTYRSEIHLSTSVWMRQGMPCTFIVTEDLDHAASCRAGEVVEQLRLHCVPGHLCSVSHSPRGAARWVAKHFLPRAREEVERWVLQLTQEGRVEQRPTFEDPGPTARICTCPISDLMVRGCTCGAV